LLVLSEALVELQVKDEANADFGAIGCPKCGVLHTRASTLTL